MSGSREEILATGVVSAKDFDEAAELAVKLFDVGQKICAERGLILVDTKYEFGRDKSGRLVAIDEVHTPDSSRFWQEATYPERFRAGQDPDPLDKDFVRRWYIGQGYKGDGEPPAMTDEVRARALRTLHRRVRADHRRTLRARCAAASWLASPSEPRHRSPLMKAKVIVRVKPEVLDPQGSAVKRALDRLGFAGVSDVRVGKVIEIEIDEAHARAPDLERRLAEMADGMLANPVTEDYEVVL